ncbi:MAG: ATP-grasp domain-containing protein, partial [Bacteroidota bacterium]
IKFNLEWSIDHSKLNLIYTNSENAYGWMYNNLGGNPIIKIVEAFKDKYKFRQFTREMYPDFYYKSVHLNELDQFDFSKLTYPIIIKPSSGFFSIGVHKINQLSEWPIIIKKLQEELVELAKAFPREVIDGTQLLIEQYITGREFAFDAYFNDQGEVVILNVLEHIFSGEDDVSDRVYITSTSLIKQYHDLFKDFLLEVSNKIPLHEVPLHVEVRVDDHGLLMPIEINPLRFGGMCSTADFTYHAYGFNPYEYYFNQQKPDWEAIEKDVQNRLFAIIVLDNSTGINGKSIQQFDYDSIIKGLKSPIEFRKMDYTKYPFFGMCFIELESGELEEVDWLLKSDLKEYIISHKL